MTIPEGVSEPLSALAERALGIALDVAKKDGQKQVDVRVDARRDADANVRFARSGITTSGQGDELSIKLWIGLGQRHASASINQTDEAGMRSLATRAVTMAKLSPEDPERMPLLAPQTYVKVPSGYDDAVAAMGPTERAAVATRAIAIGKAGNVKVAGFLERAINEHVLHTSTGLVASNKRTQVGYSLTARTPDATGSGWAGRESYRFADIEDQALSKTAIDKAIKSASPKPLDPGKYTVILEPQAVFELIDFMIQAMDQRSADEGRSFFAGKVGEKLLHERVTIKSDPSDPLTPDTAYDAEGFALAPHTWIENGRVKDLAVSRYWAQKKNLRPTGGHGAYHLFGGKEASIDDMIKSTRRGLLVTRFWYNRWLDPQSVMITGLTRDGVYLIENGKVVRPVMNFRYNESPITVLKNVDAMTKTTFRVLNGGSWRVPALRTNEFTMASTSAAV